jgi:hypothetical protein
MARRVGRSGAKPGPLALELVVGVGGPGGRCQHLGDGPCPDPYGCLSEYEDEAEAEASYWHHRDRLLEGAEGSRPAGFWTFEAPAVCAHEPRCAVPADTAGGAGWLAAHDALEPRERAAVLRRDEPEGSPRRAMQDAIRAAEAAGKANR